ncbi:hypothetical protein [Lactobacillus amylovorus]|uniref:hypothetical protein n=1 Tax=Lactobacillus amylovorus TaxID=1604 RepID=UPI003D057087
MKIKINPDKKAEEWHVGDVISDGQYSHIAVIVQDANCNFVAMDIVSSLDSFSLEKSSTWCDPFTTIEDLKDNLSVWHKVDATLIINSDIKQDED